MKRFILLLNIFASTLSFGQNKNITLDDLWKWGTFRIKSVPGFNGMKDGNSYTQIDVENGKQQINVYSLQTGKKSQTLFANTQQPTIRIEDYVFSNDESKIVIYSEGQNIYRRSVLYRVYVFDILQGKLELLSDEKVLHASISPDNQKVAYVQNNNLYCKNITTGELISITQDGKRNEIINGNCDWVYEEEFEFTKAFEWSPNSNYIAYYRFDEKQVPEYTMAIYDSLYPTQYTYKYPKAGEPNSIVTIKCFDLQNKQTKNLNIGSETNQYIPRIKWTKDPNKVCVYRMNRHQNKLELLLADARNGSSESIYSEENRYYVEINDNLQFLNDGESFVFNSERSGYNHLYRWNWNKKKLIPLTSGKYDIDAIVGIDEPNKQVYYTSTEKSPLQRALYCVSLNGKHKKLLTPQEGTHNIIPTTGYHFFLDNYSPLNEPPTFSLYEMNGKLVRTLEDNHELKKRLTEFRLGHIQTLQLRGKSEMLNGWMITPPDFDSTKKYPVLMFQYSGPGSQEVADRFPVRDYFWHQMLAQKGYIILCVDGTGTGFRGEEFKKKTYLTLGNLESNDQIAVAKSISHLAFVDSSRIGIWGWSFGGFMSSTCILKGNNVFKMAIAVAPVTNWRFYDNIYTERYMRTPQENEKGYDDNAPEKMANGLKGKFLIIHGTADDNVHFQNEVMLVNALINANKQFEAEYYPNKAHGISGGNSRFHLYKRMTDFILQNL
ncbi:MAG: S9 family peptidase [Bacteroidetes bacterium]|nr:S9 family peptidase [Bacteroidota bacterium]